MRPGSLPYSVCGKHDTDVHEALPGPRLPERLLGLHRCQHLPGVRQRDNDRVVRGPWELTASALPALAAVAVERPLALYGEVARVEVDDLGAAPGGEHQGEDDG